jgi:hypothetical protein
MYILCYVCATVDSALVRTTQCALCSTAQIFIFENELFPTTAVQQKQQVAAVRLIATLVLIQHPLAPPATGLVKGPLVQWCCVAGGTAAGGRHFVLKVELDGV